MNLIINYRVKIITIGITNYKELLLGVKYLLDIIIKHNFPIVLNWSDSLMSHRKEINNYLDVFNFIQNFREDCVFCDNNFKSG